MLNKLPFYFYHRLRLSCYWYLDWCMDTEKETMTPQFAFARADKIQKPIREAARKAGYIFIDTFRLGSGFPDAIVLSKSKRWVTFEIKSKGKGFTPDEIKFLNSLSPDAPHYTITSINDFFAAMILEDRE